MPRKYAPIWVMGMLLLGMAPALALPAGADSTPAQEQCPLTSEAVKAALVRAAFRGRAGEPLKIGLRMTPPEPPSGFYYSSLVDVLQAPAGAHPKVLTGVPEITIQCDRAGEYLLRVRVNLIAKSSCGGAKASTILDDKVSLTVF